MRDPSMPMANWDASIVFCSDFVIRSAIVICHCECKPYPMTTDTALICPRCELPLKEVRTSGGVFWACDNCGGRAATIELLRHRFMPESINPLWLHAMRGEGRSGVPCPSCRHPMIDVALSDRAEINVDVCRRCNIYFSLSLATTSKIFSDRFVISCSSRWRRSLLISRISLSILAHKRHASTRAAALLA